jgi:hypothetical protein
MLFSGCTGFDAVHRSIWYFGSTIFVVLLWFLNVYLFRIKSVPAYTDIMSFSSSIMKRRKR